MRIVSSPGLVSVVAFPPMSTVEVLVARRAVRSSMVCAPAARVKLVFIAQVLNELVVEGLVTWKRFQPPCGRKAPSTYRIISTFAKLALPVAVVRAPMVAYTITVAEEVSVKDCVSPGCRVGVALFTARRPAVP